MRDWTKIVQERMASLRLEAGAESKSSMAFDLETGHPSEIDHINGAVVAFGRRTGIATPYNDAVLRLIKAKEALRS